MDSPAAQKVTNSKNCKVCHKYFVVQQVLLLGKYVRKPNYVCILHGKMVYMNAC